MKHDPASFAAASAYRGAIADRIERFMPMVRRQAWHLFGAGRPGLEIEDLMQAGLVALTECAQRHAGPGEDGFAAYAKLRVRGAMVDLIRRMVPLARIHADRRRTLDSAERSLRRSLGREPSLAELAEATGIDLTEVATLRSGAPAIAVQSLDAAYSDHDAAFADDAPGSFDVLADAEMREHLIGAIAALPERAQLVVQLYFVEELNLSEIAQVLGVSVPRVHQLKARALELLREQLGHAMEVL
jgi:RNA polymerase sigma factor for flagellar operon FliA